MHIEDLEEGSEVLELVSTEAAVLDGRWFGVFEPKRVIVGVGARFLFYPTLFYNVMRNKIQSDFRWWDEVDQFLLLGAVPFPGDVPHLKQIGVGGVITMNEPYETLVPTSLYHAYGIEHLVLPTRDYLFAPSFEIYAGLLISSTIMYLVEKQLMFTAKLVVDAAQPLLSATWSNIGR
ncbi:hypothetical protein HPP92_020268 [Vanilla planifolia]|uniref:Uncharacterized protein n=1 Tax=Vanilla planifolia TaxID=51239 RepID=A0A835Q2G3_VANPL|nr:hypothetical protein HPP92_020268 [Vanilla planifolia]